MQFLIMMWWRRDARGRLQKCTWGLRISHLGGVGGTRIVVQPRGQGLRVKLPQRRRVPAAPTVCATGVANLEIVSLHGMNVAFKVLASNIFDLYHLNPLCCFEPRVELD